MITRSGCAQQNLLDSSLNITPSWRSLNIVEMSHARGGSSSRRIACEGVADDHELVHILTLDVSRISTTSSALRAARSTAGDTGQLEMTCRAMH